ncbi:MAG: hypothetical protein RMK18_08320 [Armatimonadota bacterium]|nr:hypothetical protein [Armatimonadota bacterium]MCX7777854.1 hypothetical protein [Armatimonadota bacterium]MDW8025846.1 hypothetical protein [Armatimonadota bacterium]
MWHYECAAKKAALSYSSDDDFLMLRFLKSCYNFSRSRFFGVKAMSKLQTAVAHKTPTNLSGEAIAKPKFIMWRGCRPGQKEITKQV